jgi:hypothetical protein
MNKIKILSADHFSDNIKQIDYNDVKNPIL